jgi:hypothetical protein
MTENSSLSLRFRGHAATVEDLQAEISAALRELGDPASSFANRASEADFNAAEFAGAEVSVAEDAKGFGEVLILITIAAPAATHIINKVWDDLIWPRIKSRLGADALGEAEKEAEKADE